MLELSDLKRIARNYDRRQAYALDRSDEERMFRNTEIQYYIENTDVLGYITDFVDEQISQLVHDGFGKERDKWKFEVCVYLSPYEDENRTDGPLDSSRPAYIGCTYLGKELKYNPTVRFNLLVGCYQEGLIEDVDDAAYLGEVLANTYIEGGYEAEMRIDYRMPRVLILVRI